jgi:hypothetical protein
LEVNMPTDGHGKLIGSDGRPIFGLRDMPVVSLNINDFRPHGSKTRPIFGAAGLKRWIFLGVCNEDIIFGLAVVHLGYLSNLFTYVFDRKEKKILKEFDLINPAAAGTLFSGSSVDGRVSFSAAGAKADISFSGGAAALSVKIGDALEAGLSFSRAQEPLNIVTRTGLKGFNYTNKEAGLPVEGKIRAAGKEYGLDGSKPCGNLDYTFGILKRQTFWNWASGGGKDSNGKKIGFNFSQGVNETGFTENAFWIDGKMVKVDTVDFIYDDLNMLSEWKMRSSDGKVNISFKPEGERAKNLNIGVIKSYYHQPFGTFTGEFSDGKEKYTLKEVYGFTEEHEAVW